MTERRAARQELYGGGLGGQASPGGGGPARVSAPPAAGNIDDGLIRAAGNFGDGLARALARDYHAGQQALAQERVVDVQNRFLAWKQDYALNRRGKDAANALRDFSEKYRELSEEALEEWQGPENEEFRGRLRRELFSRGLIAARDGFAHQARESQAFRESVWQGLLAQHEQLLASDLYDSDAVNYSVNRLAQAWQDMNPGLDPSAAMAKIAGESNGRRLEALLARAEAGDEEALAMAGQILDGSGASHVPAKSAHGLSGPISRYKYSLPANVEEKIRQAARKYDFPEEYALAVAMQESGGRQDEVSHAGAIGVMQLMPGTARELGVNPRDLDQNIDGGVRYLKRMYDQNGGDMELALTAYNFGQGNLNRWKAGKRGIRKESFEYAGRVEGFARQIAPAGISAKKAASAQARIARIREARARQAREAAENSQLRQWLQDWSDEQPERQMANLANAVSRIEDPETRARLFRLGKAQLDFKINRQLLNDKAQAAEFIRRNSEADPLSRWQALQGAELSPGARKLAEKMLLDNGGKENPANRSALAMARLLVENDQLQSAEEREIYALKNNLTPAQTRAILEYRSNEDTISPSEVATAIKRWGLEDAQFGEIYDFVKKRFKGKNKPDNADIEREVARLALRGNVAGGGFLGMFDGESSLLDARDNGKLNQWRANVEPWEAEDLDRLLKASGKSATEHNRVLLKTLNALKGIYKLPREMINWD